MNPRALLLLPVLAACGRVEVPPQPVQRPIPYVVYAECPEAPVNEPRLTRLPPPQEPQQVPEPPPGVTVRVLRDQTTSIALELNQSTVFCSHLGYSASFLKVSVPDLDWLAHFDHRVDETGLPCAAAGPCSDTVNPENLLSSNPALAVVPVRVVLEEHLNIDAAARTCTRHLVENVTVQLADRVLRHQVESDPVDWPYEKCAALAAP